MRIELTQTPSSPTIIVGFPGIGLVGPIVTEFLIDHMKTDLIGSFQFNELPATAAVHRGKLVNPMAIHYSEKHNTLIVYTILNVRKEEWKVAEAVADLAKRVNAKEILCIDGATVTEAGEQVFSFGNPQFQSLGAKPMEESVIMGPAAALLLSHQGVSCLFAATQSEMPDSKAAAEAVKLLDKYLGLGVDYHPLLEQAERFEQKIKGVLSESQRVQSARDKKSMDYFG